MASDQQITTPAGYDGGPAFPVPERPTDPDAFDDPDGMSLRDYFAAHAMMALAMERPKSVPVLEGWALELASVAYIVADAMLAERRS